MSFQDIFDAVGNGGFSTPANFVTGDVLDQLVAYTEPSRSEVSSTLTALKAKYPNFQSTCRNELPKYTPVTGGEIASIFSALNSNSAATLATLADAIGIKWLEKVKANASL
ncbi:hypothetical protein KF4_019 [Vibrio phage vB_VpaS_KF4]|nr:hypothetical protein KF3_082 [Vibrio phage vB_VpaS_KF3]ATI19232.1 hypothetical protein KF4_019 [Vibrio phage vB_VpaS_KF4]